jgi:A/G-specific adenine glycosylase
MLQSEKDSIDTFRKTVYSYFRKYGRVLPWRTDYDPYHIFISEVMLQQTQVDRVLPKFSYFVNELPDFRSLSAASLDKVLSLWNGLGYNRRALHLKNAAIMIMEEFSGKLPQNPELIVTPPGIGPATASSIAVFAFNKPAIFLETNIRTVLIHHFFKSRKKPVDEKDLYSLAEQVLDRKSPRRWYSALMDYGTFLKKTEGNLSQRSSVYKKQTSFHGSRRQVRGKIIKVLLESKGMKEKDLLIQVGCEKDLFGDVLAILEKENIISKHSVIWRIGGQDDPPCCPPY